MYESDKILFSHNNNMDVEIWVMKIILECFILLRVCYGKLAKI